MKKLIYESAQTHLNQGIWTNKSEQTTNCLNNGHNNAKHCELWAWRSKGPCMQPTPCDWRRHGQCSHTRAHLAKDCRGTCTRPQLHNKKLRTCKAKLRTCTSKAVKHIRKPVQTNLQAKPITCKANLRTCTSKPVQTNLQGKAQNLQGKAQSSEPQERKVLAKHLEKQIWTNESEQTTVHTHTQTTDCKRDLRKTTAPHNKNQNLHDKAQNLSKTCTETCTDKLARQSSGPALQMNLQSKA